MINNFNNNVVSLFTDIKNNEYKGDMSKLYYSSYLFLKLREHRGRQRFDKHSLPFLNFVFRKWGQTQAQVHLVQVFYTYHTHEYPDIHLQLLKFYSSQLISQSLNSAAKQSIL